MKEIMPWDGQSRFREHLTCIVALVVAAVAFVCAPACAADQGSSAQKRISVLAADPAQPVPASQVDGVSGAPRPAASSADAVGPHATARRHAIRALENAPLSFIDNRGQADARAAFYARRDGATFWLTRGGLVFDLSRQAHPAVAGVHKVSASDGSLARVARGPLERAVVPENFLGADPAVKLDPQMEQPARYGYIHGSDSSQWIIGVKSYSLITYRGVWRGVDLRVYGLGRNLEQEFLVAPGASPDAIQMGFSGAQGMRIARDGSLVVDTAAGPMRELPPFAYQHVDGKRVAVATHFKLDGENRVGFTVASYQHGRPLVIDPPVLYATYLGGIHDDEGQSIAVDAAGNSYVAGFTASTAFPVSATAFQTARAEVGYEIYNAFVTKLSPAGAILYSTFVGGTPDRSGTCGSTGFVGDCAEGIAVDTAGNAYVTGSTASSDFPITPASAFQPAFGGGNSDAFLFELSPDGSHLVYSTFFGGDNNEGGAGIATDGSGHVWIGGNVSGTGTFPSTPGAFQRKIKGPDNGVVAKFDLTQVGAASLAWSTLLGGTSPATYGGVYSLTVDAAGDVFVTGQTHSTDYPTTSTALKPKFSFSGSCQGNGSLPYSAAFVSKLSPNGSTLLYSTFVGGEKVASELCDQYAHAITLDASGNIWILGATSTSDFPTTTNAYSQTFLGGQYSDMFVYEIKQDGSQKLYGTYFGGSGDDWRSFGLAVDARGDVYFGGESNSGSDYPTKDATQTYGGGYDAVISEILPCSTSTALEFSTFLGGSTDDVVQGFALDSQGNIHVSGATASTNFPVVNAVQTQFADGMAGANLNDAFIAEFGTGLIGKVTPALGGNFGSTTVTLTGAGFESGATAELSSGGSSVASGQFVKVSTDGATLRTTFDLTAVPPGTYDIEVVNPDTTSFVAPHSFTVQTGGGANLWVTLVGRSLIRVGSPSTFTVSYGNTGLNDAYLARVWVQFPTASLNYQLGATLTQPQITGNPIDVSGVPLDVKVGDQTVLPLIIPVVPAGGTGSVPISFTAATSGGITLKTWVNPAGSASIAPVLNPAPQPANSLEGSIGAYSMPQCYADMAQYAYEAFAFSAPQVCWNVFPQTSQNVAGNAVAAYMNGDASLNNFLMSLTQFLDQQDLAVDQCLQSHGVGLADWSGVLDSTVQSLVQLVENTITKDDCKVKVVVKEKDNNDQDDGGDSGTNGGSSADPNDKSGPTGVTAARWVLANQPLTYTISFENEPTATLPARQVVITDKLDPTKVDLTTLALGPMGFNKTSITPPASVNNYSTTVSLASDLSVQVQGSLNPTTGVVKWTFRSLDPTTNLPPIDLNVGFLPADKTPPAGEGSVVFSVMPKKHPATGAKVANQATVVFDTNAPIKTPIWTNHIAGPVPQGLSITPASLTFRHVPIFGVSDGTSAVQRVTLTNPGPQPMVVANISASSDFLVGAINGCKTVLAPGQSCAFNVRFRPTDIGTTPGQVTISDNAAKSPQTVTLNGIAVPGALTFTPPALTFGKVKISTTSPAKKLKMTNATDAQAMIVSVTASAGFVTSKDTCTGATLSAAQSCTVAVAFDPTGAQGPVEGQLTVTTDAKVQQVTLSGRAIP